MSDVNQSGSAAVAPGSADAQVDNATDQTVSNDASGSAAQEMSESFKKRMQADLVRLKKANADLATQLERERQAKLEASGDLSSVNESLKKQLAEANEKFHNVALGVKDFVIESTVKNLANEFGCNDVETLMKFINHDEIESDGVRVNVDQVKHFMEDMRKRKPHLFIKTTVNPRIGTPLSGAQSSQSTTQTQKTFDPKKASAQELKDMIISQFGRKQ